MNDEQKLPPGEEDIPERIAAFNAALQPLLGKYELGLAAVPYIDPQGLLKANPTLVSMRKPVTQNAPVEGDEPAPAEAKPEAPAPVADEPSETLID